jgi:hypothetical protein
VDTKKQMTEWKAEREETIRGKLIPEFQPDRIFHHKLYGRVGTLTFGDAYKTYPKENKVSLGRLAELLEAFPPVNTVKAKGTFTRFLPELFADSDANKEKGREELALIFPVILKTESVSGFTLTAEWFTDIDGETWEVNAILAEPSRLANIHARRIEYRGGYRYDSNETRLSINSALNPPDGYWNKVKWAAGSPEYISPFTAYHSQYDVDPVQWARQAAANLLKPNQMEVAI